ncbi:putative branched-chain-amino-acid aminotransferase [Corynebacterium occultum]|uniref:Putative branched-chain-amino-acid aminotransferase n=1 Tax=Corynebacterium occultum TaxID=2675219 RepID=A0A6B8WPC9_9CORY|nr:aminodeoxychorismate lyase [Corynebacterium occultum]QGU08208.1 putative branched-chain-amino-acid aminotransferase [Corynebacterium occultum]
MPLSPATPIILVVEPFGGSTRRHNPSLPLVYWDDAAVTRGDGVFETLLLRDGRAANLERHLRRFRASVKLMGLPEQAAEHWRKATAEAVEAWYEKNDSDARCVWTLTRGRESTGIPTAWITVREVGETSVRQRREGVSVMTTERGYSINEHLPGVHRVTSGTPTEKKLKDPAPWLTVGAKTLNYAANMAALRYARNHGFEDIIYVDDDRVLEGATSTVVIVKKGRRLRTPVPGGDILPGTTQAALFAYAEKHGWKCREKNLWIDDLFSAESVWLVSSVRVAARVTRINDVKLPAPANVAEVEELITRALAE